jgi:ATP-dependent Clp protease protease subunit
MSKQYSELIEIGTENVLRKNRIINLVGEVDTKLAYHVTSELLVMAEESDKPIQMFINSPGGSVLDGLAIIDVMNFISAPVYTIVTGLAASMGAAILSAGEKGHRMALPNATIMLHQMSSGTHGNIQDMRVSMAFNEKLNEKLAKMLSTNCGKTHEEYEKDTSRDYWMFAQEAKEYGIIDQVIENT